MKFSRRDFVHAGCAVAAASLVPNPVEAWIHGSASAFSQRSVINIGPINDNSYPFINFFLAGDANVGPVGSAFSTGTPFPALVDANGWPNQPGVSGTSFGGSVRIPGADEYSGNWIITWSGSGRADIHLGGGTWTESNLVTAGTGTFTNGSANIGFTNSFVAGQQVVFTSSGTLPTNFSPLTVYYVIAAGLSGSNIQVSATKGGSAIVAGSAGSGTQTVNGTYLKNTNGTWTNTFDTISPYIIASWAGTSGPQLVPLSFSLTDPNLTGNYLKNFKFYQQGDETDLLAGKTFRANYKQLLVNLNPSVIRFLNYYGSNATRECRFENRGLATNAAYDNFGNWISSPSYPAVTGTNLYSVGVAVPTTANPKNTPGSLMHGEIALVRFTNAAVRSNGQYSISAIANGPNAQVTTSAPHGLNSGDTVIHFNMVGMSKLNYFPVVVTVVDATHYTIGIDTTSYGAFTSGLGTQYWSINVGARGAKPICWVDGSSPGSSFGAFITAGSYCMLVYDKNIQIQSDGAGNMIAGAWTMDGAGSNGSRQEMPLEIMTALVNEVNTLSVSQGISTPINMWINSPHTGLTSMDPDYTSASDWALNATDVILNPASVQRTGGYSALTANAKLFVEYSNETWNSASQFWSAPYLARMGFLRWPTSGTANYVDMYALRSTIVMRLLTATYGLSRLRRVLSGQGFVGFANGGLNQSRCDASSTPGQAGNFYLTDALASGFGTPITNHDCFATATYFDGDPTYYSGQFVTDSATYALGGSTNQNAAIASFVSDIVSGSGQSINGYLNNSLTGLTATYAAAMVTRGKFAINYEGGADWQDAVGQSLQGVHTITSADRTFILAMKASTQWRDAQIGYFNRTSQLPGSAMPAVYLFISQISTDQRWADTSPDSFGGTATEGQGLLNSAVWVGMGARNQGLT